ncbi:hypothetical protein SLS53_007940 [Cytospora paraplurivora]|uniref:Cytochrome P450 n=1 Tax=Cytospora paraplurivora TaxID=2898453 RepID=A0AAN9U239_9PEZI
MENTTIPWVSVPTPPPSSNWVSPTTGLIIGLLIIGLYTVYQWFLPKPIPGIPYNKEASKRLLGDFPDMRKELKVTSEFNLWCARQVEKMRSPLCQVFVNPFMKPWLLLADFPEAQDILMRRKDFDRSTFIRDGMLPLGHFQACLTTNESWKGTRAWVQDLMTPTFLNRFVGPAIYSHVLELVEIWNIKAHLAKGRPFTATADLMSVSTDTMVTFAFGDNLDSWDAKAQLGLLEQLDSAKFETGSHDDPVTFPRAPVHDFITAAHEGTEVVEVSVNHWLPKILAVWHRNFSRWYNGVMEAKERIIREQIGVALQNLRSGEVKSAVEHMLMREEAIAEKAGRQPDYYNQKMKDEFLTVILRTLLINDVASKIQIFGLVLAGLHTTGSALAWIVKYLTENPDVQSKLRSHLHTAFAQALVEGRSPTYAEMTRGKPLPYLEAVVEESLRCHSTTVTREATRDTELLGHHIPKGTTVFLVSNGPGYYSPSLPVDDTKRSDSCRNAARPGRWDESKDMRAFDPERWLVKNADGKIEFDANAGPQTIFGLGPRGCFGKRLAYIEMRMVTALLVWHFELQDVPKALSGHAATDGISHRAKQCYVRPKKI